ncbi:hypothetical protein DNU06_06590 [Putridiphycobacter roseus]|uniref:Histidyl-tRNA synthetase n=1 Tax=Putridiphycobacter roseus TaxID=2219161 RepID=A0A2W1N392_9FLAO|nr:DUF6495 family protein [Putridiphycobacter roseus]PZE17491.1 hypothetical protein DNU06_06590 [Putridiphycobacter roseus]
MAKYRTLSITELESFEKEFISFLVINGIEADNWEEIKKNEPIKANKIIEQFSAVVFESIFRKNMFIDFISAKTIKCFQFLADSVQLIGLDAEEGSEVDFMKANSIRECIIQNEAHLKVYQSNKKYIKSREEEMYNMVQSGANLSKGELFKQIALLL